MEQPSVRSSIYDPERDVTFHVMAYRELARAERVAAVRHALASTPKRKHPKPGSTWTIVTIIGFDQR